MTENEVGLEEDEDEGGEGDGRERGEVRNERGGEKLVMEKEIC